MRRMLDNDDLTITAATTAKDVAERDSFSHVELIVAIEKHFRLQFAAREIQSFRNLVGIGDAILRRQAKGSSRPK
jgi:acyl carrier protein